MPITELLLPTNPDHRGPAHPELPLQGLTLLAVEDSRFACEALRLMCLRSGARLRRAETLELAARHLAVYRPDVVIVDLGLPDGDGADLIRALTLRPGPAVLATSGDATRRADALAAGAVGFLEKPLEDLERFQTTVLDLLKISSPNGRGAPTAPIRPDRLALRDDLVHAENLLTRSQDGPSRRYAAGFLGSIAQSSHDAALARAAGTAAETTGCMAELHTMVRARLANTAGAFSHAPDQPARH